MACRVISDRKTEAVCLVPPHSLLLNQILECIHLFRKVVRSLVSTEGAQEVAGFAALLFSYNIFLTRARRRGRTADLLTWFQRRDLAAVLAAEATVCHITFLCGEVLPHLWS